MSVRSKSGRTFLPLKVEGALVLLATMKAGTSNVVGGLPETAVKLMVASLSPSSSLLQSTVAKTRCSVFSGDIDPWLGDTVSQVALTVVVNVKGVGPPAPTSINRFGMGSN
jgi:hypothetical protein